MFIGLDIYCVYLPLVNHLQPSDSVEDRINTFLGTTFFVTAGLTLLTTALIAFRIYVAIRDQSHRTQYNKILEIVIQSSLLYSFSSVVYAIPSVIPMTPENFGPLGSITNYISTVAPLIAVCQHSSFHYVLLTHLV